MDDHRSIHFMGWRRLRLRGIRLDVEHVPDQDILTGRRAAKGYVLLLR